MDITRIRNPKINTSPIKVFSHQTLEQLTDLNRANTSKEEVASLLVLPGMSIGGNLKEVATSLQKAVPGINTSISLTLSIEVSRLKECRISHSKTTTKKILTKKLQASRTKGYRPQARATMFR